MEVLCFDIGGTSVKYGIVKDGVIIDKESMPTNVKNGRSDLTVRIINKAKEMVKKYPNVSGVGISCTGCIDFDNAKMIEPPLAIPEFGEWDFRKDFKEELGLDVVADNDVNSFASCECHMGAGLNYKTFLVMTVGTGIGGAIVVNGKMWRGNDFSAGEIGRMLVDGTPWEKIASMTSLVHNAKLRGLDVNEGKDVFDLYDQGNKIAQILISEFYQNLGKGLANLIYIFNPEAIIIGGGISSRDDFGVEVNAYADYYLVDGFQDTIDIIPAKYRNDGGMLGAYCNFIEKYRK